MKTKLSIAAIIISLALAPAGCTKKKSDENKCAAPLAKEESKLLTGKQADNRTVIINGRILTPEGTQVKVGTVALGSALSSDGKLLASASEDRMVRIWKVVPGK